MNENFNKENNSNETWQSPYDNSQNYVNYSQEDNSYQPNYQIYEDPSDQYEPYAQNTFNVDQQNDLQYYNPYNPYSNQQFNQPEPKPKKNKTKVALITTLSTLFAIAILAIPTVFVLEKKNLLPESSKINQANMSINIKDATEDETALTASEVYKKVENSIVGIKTYGISENFNEVGQGSGIIISKDGYIVTNAHVIGNSKTSKSTVLINTDKSQTEHEAQIVGLDVKTDLAVLKIDANDLTPAEFGNSDQAEIGSTVLAIGNPGGLEFSNSFTRGMISAKDRKLPSTGLVNFIQTDATINPGNSGGALLDMHGRVIGVNSAKLKAENFEGMGFAIPSNTVKQIVDEIIKNGHVTGRACLGVSCQEVSPIMAKQYGIPQGLLIKEILSNSNLQAAGVKPNDIITKINDKDVTTTASLVEELKNHSINERVKLTITRRENTSIFNNESQTFTVEVALVENKGQ